MEELKNPDIVDHNYVKKRIAKIKSTYQPCQCRDCGSTIYASDAEDVEYILSRGEEIFICKRCGRKEDKQD
jgi:hypothetical protein|uniref:Transcription initiation factor IIE, alpha FINGER, Transcription n=1 Tax=Siphoviridae sp. ctGMq5 TaxID=2826220 RepID=A0A8S5NMJ4_9CAUD|nr:MAG TPA: Transcription initiation factor IIE, alpha FINGER, Transcription [Siphoviridae sp. ctGMq5]